MIWTLTQSLYLTLTQKKNETRRLCLDFPNFFSKSNPVAYIYLSFFLLYKYNNRNNNNNGRAEHSIPIPIDEGNL